MEGRQRAVSYTHLDVYKRQEQASGWSEPVRVTAGGAIAAIEDRSFRRNTTFGCYVLFLTGDFEPGVYGLEVAGRRTTCIQDDSDRTIGLEIWEDDTAAEFFSQPATLYPVSYTHLDVYKRQPLR